MNAFDIPLPSPFGALPPTTATASSPPVLDAGNSWDCSGLQLNLISTLDKLDALGPEWNALFERAGTPHQVFQTFGFATLWARHFLPPHQPATSRRTAADRLAVLTAHRGGRLVLVWPLVVQHELGLRVLTGLGDPVAQYSDALLDPDEDGPQLLHATFQHALATTSPDMIRLRKVRADAAIAPLLARIGTFTADPVEAPYVTLRGGGSSFEERQSGKAKKNRRRLMRRLEEQGIVAFQHAAGSAAAGALLASALVAKRDWLQRRGLLSPAIANPRLDGFLLSAATSNAATTGCRLFALSLDGRPIALAMGFECKRRLMLHLITQTANVERFGTGVLNLEAILRLAEAEGLEALDMLPPKADYKEDWADGTVAVCDHVQGLTAAGRLWAMAFDRIVKPRLKRTVQALPISIRQRLAARALERG